MTPNAHGDDPLLVVEPARTILGLLSAEAHQFGRTILLTGPWGCGKTYLWKHEIAPRLGRQHIYISAFGAEGAANLNGRLLVHLATNLIGRVPLKAGARERVSKAGSWLRERLGRTGQAISTSLNSIGGALLRRADLDALELVDLLDESTVICIDDLERVSTSFKFEDLMGMANIISEHKRLDVVLVCNEDEILRGDNPERAKQYLRHKEKTISMVRHISADPIVMFGRIAEGAVRTVSALTRVRAAEPVIGEVFQRSKTVNLRLLAKVCGYLEALEVAGVRELTEAETRFLTAVTVCGADETVTDDQFFEFDPVVLRVISSMHKAPKLEAPDVARLRFIERFFGENDYAYNAGIVQLVRRGTIDANKFAAVVEQESSPFKRSLDRAVRGEWRYWTDDQLKRLIAELVDHLASAEVKNAQDVLCCLAYFRVWAQILGEPSSEEGERLAKEALRLVADKGNGAFASGTEFTLSGLSRFIKSEFDAFMTAAETARRRHVVREAARVLEGGDIADIAKFLGRADSTHVKAAFEVLDVVMPLATTSPRGFELIVRELLEQAQMLQGVWPEASIRRADLLSRVEAVKDICGADHLMRWRIDRLLEQAA